MANPVISYEIHKGKSVIAWIILLVPLVLVFFLIVAIVGSGKNVSSVGAALWVFLPLIIFSSFLFIRRLLPWRQPYRVEWSDVAITIRYPNSKETNIPWSDIREIVLEGERLEALKKLVPSISFFYIGHFTWNAAFWAEGSGRPWFGSGYSFIHLFTTNKRWITVPIPNEMSEAVTQLLHKLFESKILKIEVRKLRPWFARFIQVIAVAAIPIPILLALLTTFTLGGLQSTIVGIFISLLSAVGLSLLLLLLILAFNAFFRQQTTIEGLTVFGRWAYLPGCIYLLIAGLIIYFIAGSIFK